MVTELTDWMDRARLDARLSHGELWMRYFELGGMSTAVELEAFLYGALQPAAHDHDLIALALNERFAERADTRRIAYTSDDTGATWAPSTKTGHEAQ